MATPYFLPNSISPFLTNPSSSPPIYFTKSSFFTSPQPLPPTTKPGCRIQLNATPKKKNPWLDPFDDGEDPNMEYGSLFADGKQEEDPRPPDNPDNPYGFLKFPMGYSVEIASLALKVRGDVRRCCCVISGGVYENLLFFPAIQLIKDRYPGVQVDVLASPRGKQTYELNKNVRWANAYDPDVDFPDPAEYTDMIGILKARYYDMILSTKLAGLGHAAFLFMSTARDRVSYIYPNVNAAGAGLLLSQTFTPDGMNLSEAGYNMGIRPIFVIPHEKVREEVEEEVEDASIVFITTPGQLAALINDSLGVIATNTAAVQLATAREKPCIALFSSQQKGELFVPNAQEKKCLVVSSKTGKLVDINVEAVKKATGIFDVSLALA
ncbi:hypothetical protein PVL29_012052 [Vitis rotundifolia]|uniref:Uncharacterized protein n=1 Tax=Vitis rotundifolia TaxID=103349 RepID=A0AA39DR73_VITRO|nr:hypothetical protein PVL29_012052 [Vitis rotundifolia]